MGGASSSPGAFAARVCELQNEGAYAVLARANELDAQAGDDGGNKVAHLEIGQPGFAPPAHVNEALVDALSRGFTKYAEPRGIKPLREAIARYVERTRRLPPGAVDPECVVVGPGAKPGLFLSSLALLEPGDEVLVPDPGFPTYRAMVEVCDAVAVPYPLRDDTDAADVDAVEALVTPRTKMVVVNSPGNPTGGVMGARDVEHLKRIVQRTAPGNMWILSDEIYSRLYYGGGGGDGDSRAPLPPSPFDDPATRDRTVLVDGLSKSFSMTGFRIGYAVVPRELAERMELLMVHSVGCVATFTQYAALAALADDARNERYIEQMRETYRRHRDIIVELLRDIPGVRLQVPQGAFYAWLDVSAFGVPVRQLAAHILERARVALLAGTDFGERGGRGRLRISYVGDEDTLREGARRLRSYLLSLRSAHSSETNTS